MIQLLAPMLIEKGLGLLGGLFDSGSELVQAKATEFVKEKTGIDLAAKKSLSDADVMALKQLESTERLTLENLRYADTKDARNMQVEALKQDDVFSKRFVYYFAISWSLFAMLYLAGITFLQVDVESVRFADTIIGFLLGTVVSTLIGFFYGSSDK